MVMIANQTGMEIGHLATKYAGSLGHLYSPAGRAGPFHWMPFALDNGAYGAFKNKKEWDVEERRDFLRWAALSGERPLWAVVPDVVGKRKETIARWREYVGEVARYGFRPAFAVQDDMTFADVPSPDCAIFIGGSDNESWKDRAIGPWAKAFPGRVHVARVNGSERLLACHRAGVVSVDGTGWFHRTNTKTGGQRSVLLKYLRETS